MSAQVRIEAEDLLQPPPGAGGPGLAEGELGLALRPRAGAAPRPGGGGPAVAGALVLRLGTPAATRALHAELRGARDAQATRNVLHSVHVTLTLRHADGLRAADCFGYGASDPFCVIYRDGRKQGRTRTINNSTNPVWAPKHKPLFLLDDVPTKRPEPVPPDPLDGEDSADAAAGGALGPHAAGGDADDPPEYDDDGDDAGDDDGHEEGDGGSDDDSGQAKKTTKTTWFAKKKAAAKQGKSAVMEPADAGAKPGADADAAHGDDANEASQAAAGSEGEAEASAASPASPKRLKGGAKIAADDDDAASGGDADSDFGDDPAAEASDVEADGGGEGDEHDDAAAEAAAELGDDPDPPLSPEQLAEETEDARADRGARAARFARRARREPTCTVRIDVYDDDAFGKEFLGHVELPWRRLMRPGEHTLALRDRALPPSTPAAKPGRRSGRG